MFHFVPPSGSVFACVPFPVHTFPAGYEYQPLTLFLSELRPKGIVHDNGSTVSKSLDGMWYVTWQDCDYAWWEDLSNPLDGHFEFALDHLIDLFLRMKMLMNRRTTHKFVVRECHVRRVEVAAVPSWKALNHS